MKFPMKLSYLIQKFFSVSLRAKCCILTGLLLLSSFLYRAQWNYGLYLLPALSDGTRQVSRFNQEFFQKELILNTLNLHYTLENPASYGITSYDISLGGFSTESEAFNNSALDQTLFQLSLLGKNSLPVSQKLTLDTLTCYLNQEKTLNSFPFYAEYISPSGGLLFQLPVLLAEYELGSASEVEEYLALLSLTDSYFSELMEYEQAKSDAGLFMPEEICLSIIEECENFLKDKENHYLATTFESRIQRIDSLSVEEKNYYCSLNQSVLEDSVYPAYENVMTQLAKLSDTGTNDLGLCFLPEGREYYAALLTSCTGCFDTPEELFTRIEEARLNDLLECSLLLAESPKLAEECNNLTLSYEDDKDMLTTLEKAMVSDFPSPVNSTYEVKHVEPSMENVLAPAFYITAPLDSYLDSAIYVNSAAAYPDLEYFTTLAHEGFPGHLYQTMMTYDYGMEPVRCLVDFPGFVEGWATYVEMMSYYYADIPEDVACLMQHNQAATLSLYASSDIGIHFFGWDMEDMTEFWASYGITSPEAIKEITGIILSNPGNYLSYYVGYLNFMDLRNQFQQEYGDSFSLKSFHEAILRIGPTSFELLEEYIPLYYSPQT